MFALMATHPVPEASLLRASTTKPLDDFGACFVRAQQRDSRAWAFMPTDSGGTFTNAGVNGTAVSYWLAFSEARPRNQVRLYADRHPAEIEEVVNRCR